MSNSGVYEALSLIVSWMSNTLEFVQLGNVLSHEVNSNNHGVRTFFNQ